MKYEEAIRLKKKSHAERGYLNYARQNLLKKYGYSPSARNVISKQELRVDPGGGGTQSPSGVTSVGSDVINGRTPYGVPDVLKHEFLHSIDANTYDTPYASFNPQATPAANSRGFMPLLVNRSPQNLPDVYQNYPQAHLREMSPKDRDVESFATAGEKKGPAMLLNPNTAAYYKNVFTPASRPEPTFTPYSTFKAGAKATSPSQVKAQSAQMKAGPAKPNIFQQLLQNLTKFIKPTQNVKGVARTPIKKKK